MEEGQQPEALPEWAAARRVALGACAYQSVGVRRARGLWARALLGQRIAANVAVLMHLMCPQGSATAGLRCAA